VVVWHESDVGKRTNVCKCGGSVRISNVNKKEIVKSCDCCSFTVEKHAQTSILSFRNLTTYSEVSDSILDGAYIYQFM